MSPYLFVQKWKASQLKEYPVSQEYFSCLHACWG